MPNESEQKDSPQRERVLGIDFFNGDPADLVQQVSAHGGLVLMPASPALLKLKYDAEYRRVLAEADYVLADSALLARVWWWSKRRRLRHTSGLAYLRRLVDSAEFRNQPNTFWVVASEEAKQKTIVRLQHDEILASPDRIYVAPSNSAGEMDHTLLLRLEELKPKHVIVALGSGIQEKLGLYLRTYLLYRPAVHCVGAALGFMTGSEAAMPAWADQHQLGWLARLASQPRMTLPRAGIAIALCLMLLKYGAEMPRLRTRWSDL